MLYKYVCYVITNGVYFTYGVVIAGRATTNDELENMLESGNPAIFTQGVSKKIYYVIVMPC